MANAAVDVRLRIEGHHLPGRHCGPYDDVHVALQVGRDPVGPVPGDAASAVWETVLAVVRPAGGAAAAVPEDGPAPDVRGAAVHGRKGERFAYLTWTSATAEGVEVFRRAKLPLDGVPALVDAGPVADAPAVTARVDLTDEDGMPRCARLRPPSVTWSRS